MGHFDVASMGISHHQKIRQGRSDVKPDNTNAPGVTPPKASSHTKTHASLPLLPPVPLSAFLSVSPSLRLSVSPFLRFSVSPSPRLPSAFSPGPRSLVLRLPFSPVPGLPSSVCLSPLVPVSPCPRVSSSPRLPSAFSPGPRSPVSRLPFLPGTPSPVLRLPFSPVPRPRSSVCLSLRLSVSASPRLSSAF